MAESEGTELTASRSFRRLSGILSDEGVASSLVLLGILTGQIDPVEGDRGPLFRTAVDAVNEASPVSIGPNTVKAIEWLLAEVRDQLSPERKRLIGRLVEQTGINVSNPESDTSPRSRGPTGVESFPSREQSTDTRRRSKHRRANTSRRSEIWMTSQRK